jgi:hypothetical protein
MGSSATGTVTLGSSSALGTGAIRVIDSTGGTGSGFVAGNNALLMPLLIRSTTSAPPLRPPPLSAALQVVQSGHHHHGGNGRATGGRPDLGQPPRFLPQLHPA